MRLSGDYISRQAAIDAIIKAFDRETLVNSLVRKVAVDAVKVLPPVQGKYEYHYDHTDCIWYRPEARNRCPSTCAQYRDGWNDAMNYIFRDGEGYRPFRRDKKYEG